MTRGEPSVVARDLADSHLAIAAALERASEHPLARAVLSAASPESLAGLKVVGAEAVPGRGRDRVCTSTVPLGSDQLRSGVGLAWAVPGRPSRCSLVAPSVQPGATSW